MGGGGGQRQVRARRVRPLEGRQRRGHVRRQKPPARARAGAGEKPPPTSASLSVLLVLVVVRLVVVGGSRVGDGRWRVALRCAARSRRADALLLGRQLPDQRGVARGLGAVGHVRRLGRRLLRHAPLYLELLLRLWLRFPRRRLGLLLRTDGRRLRRHGSAHPDGRGAVRTRPVEHADTALQWEVAERLEQTEGGPRQLVAPRRPRRGAALRADGLREELEHRAERRLAQGVRGAAPPQAEDACSEVRPTRRRLRLLANCRIRRLLRRIRRIRPCRKRAAEAKALCEQRVARGQHVGFQQPLARAARRGRQQLDEGEGEAQGGGRLLRRACAVVVGPLQL